MNLSLKEYGTRDEYTDAINNVINSTIENYIDEDYLYEIMPILSKVALTKDSDYWKNFKISINKESNYTDKELKTMSYLAPFYKNKVKYNTKEIIRYLRFIGYKANNEDVTLMCFDKENYDENIEYDNDWINKYITFDEYMNLSYEDILKITLFIDVVKSVNNKVIISGISIPVHLVSLNIDIDNIKTCDCIISSSLGYADGFDIGFDIIGMR